MKLIDQESDMGKVNRVTQHAIGCERTGKIIHYDLRRDKKEVLEERKEIISPLGRWHDLVRQTDAMRTPYTSDITRHAHLFLPYDLVIVFLTSISTTFPVSDLLLAQTPRSCISRYTGIYVSIAAAG